MGSSCALSAMHRLVIRSSQGPHTYSHFLSGGGARVGGTDQESEEVQELGALSPTKGSKAIPNLFPQPVPSVYAGGTGVWQPAGRSPITRMTRNWPAWPNQTPCRQLAFTSVSTFTLSTCQQGGSGASIRLGFWSLHLQPSWPTRLPLTASPESHQLGYFPADTAASRWPGRMFLC